MAEPVTASASSGTPMFDLAGISRSYAGDGPAVHALRPTDLAIERGSYTAIMGPSGSGKSTLLNLLGLLDRPSTGRLRLDGIETTRLSGRHRSAVRASTIGFVFQAFHLLPGRTVLDNVQIGLLYLGRPRSQRRQLAAQVLERVGLSHRLDADTRKLSGGERQRVAIARAIATETSVLLCDEPTGNLDRSAGSEILALIGDLHRDGATIVVVTHDGTVAAEAQTVLSVVDGVVTAAGGTGVDGVVTLTDGGRV